MKVLFTVIICFVCCFLLILFVKNMNIVYMK